MSKLILIQHLNQYSDKRVQQCMSWFFINIYLYDILPTDRFQSMGYLFNRTAI